MTPTAAVVSFRLGATDGVSIEAAKWVGALDALGFAVRTVAGEGTADVLIGGLARAGAGAADDLGAAVAGALDGADVVVVENLLSLPLNPVAADVVAAVLRGRAAVLRHHDLPWQRPELASHGVADDRAWAHVVLNAASRRELAERGIDATVMHNRFPLDGWHRGDDRSAVRDSLAVDGPLLLHPVRAIPRKDVPAAVRLAEALGATYWLTGPAEDGYGPQLDRILAAASCPVIHAAAGSRVAAGYAAADAVAFPSLLEGFGNPVIESALARRPLAVRRYPVLEEDLAPFGFSWFAADDPDPLARFLDAPDVLLLDRNEAVARAHFGLDGLQAELGAVLERVL